MAMDRGLIDRDADLGDEPCLAGGSDNLEGSERVWDQDSRDPDVATVDGGITNVLVELRAVL
jgi:hypothetical protein